MEEDSGTQTGTEMVQKIGTSFGKKLLEIGSAGLKTGSIFWNQIGSKNVNQNVSHGEHFGSNFWNLFGSNFLNQFSAPLFKS